MPTVSRTFVVTPPPSTVIPYLTDFGHAEEWDPGTELHPEERRAGRGRHDVAQRVEDRGRQGRLEYELTEVSDTGVVLVGRNDSSTSTDTIQVLPHAHGSEITYTADLEMHGIAVLATPAMKRIFENSPTTPRSR